MTGLVDGIRWEWVADGVQVLMCTVILVCLIRNRIAPRRISEPSGSQSAGTGFSQEVLLQSIRQQAEQGLQAILAVVEAERAKLQPLLAGAEVPRIPPEPEEPGLATELRPFRLGAGGPAAEMESFTRYAGLNRLAGQGLSIRQIAAQAQLPAGEVELALKLKRTVA